MANSTTAKPKVAAPPAHVHHDGGDRAGGGLADSRRRAPHSKALDSRPAADGVRSLTMFVLGLLMQGRVYQAERRRHSRHFGVRRRRGCGRALHRQPRPRLGTGRDLPCHRRLRHEIHDRRRTAEFYRAWPTRTTSPLERNNEMQLSAISFQPSAKSSEAAAMTVTLTTSAPPCVRVLRVHRLRHHPARAPSASKSATACIVSRCLSAE